MFSFCVHKDKFLNIISPGGYDNSIDLPEIIQLGIEVKENFPTLQYNTENNIVKNMSIFGSLNIFEFLKYQMDQEDYSAEIEYKKPVNSIYYLNKIPFVLIMRIVKFFDDEVRKVLFKNTFWNVTYANNVTYLIGNAITEYNSISSPKSFSVNLDYKHMDSGFVFNLIKFISPRTACIKGSEDGLKCSR